MSDFILQVHLAGPSNENDFEMAIALARRNLSVAELIDYLWPSCEGPHSEPDFDESKNPDSGQIYRLCGRAINDSRSQKCSITFKTGMGAIGHTDTIDAHIHNGILNLIVNYQYTPFQYAVARSYYETCKKIIDALQTQLMIHYLDRYTHILSDVTGDESHSGLLATANRLVEDDLLEYGEGQEGYEVTEAGYRAMEVQAADTEMMIERYDIFADVDIDEETSETAFGSARGLDIRVQVYEAEGIDPIRAVFSRMLYDNGLSRGTDLNLIDALCDKDFFSKSLEPVVNRDEVAATILDDVINDGLTLIEEDAEANEAHERNRRLLRYLDR